MRKVQSNAWEHGGPASKAAPRVCDISVRPCSLNRIVVGGSPDMNLMFDATDSVEKGLPKQVRAQLQQPSAC